jgi:predicted dehydrogenase
VVVVGAVGLELPRKPYYDKELSFMVSRSYGPGRRDPTYEDKGYDYPAGYVRWTENRNMVAFVDQLAQGQVVVEPLVTHRVSIVEAKKAYDLVTGKAEEPSLAILLTYAHEGGEALSDGRSRVDYRAHGSVEDRSTVGIGLLGAGRFARDVLLPAMGRLDGIELRGVCTASGVRAHHVARRFGFRFATTDEAEILRDASIQAVMIATRHHLHARQIQASLEANKHVFVEKPLCLDVKELDRIEDVYSELARSKDAPILMVGFNRRFAPLARRMKEFLARIDEPLIMNYRVNAGLVPLDHWTQDAEQGGGRIVGEVCHFVDFLIFLAGSLPVRIHAAALPDIGPYRQDNLFVTLELANGSVGTITYVANGASGFPKERVEVFGGGRTAALENFRSLELHRGGRREVFRSRFRQDKGHRHEMAAFIEAIRSGEPSPIPSDELFAATRSTLVVMQCVKKRSSVEI